MQFRHGPAHAAVFHEAGEPLQPSAFLSHDHISAFCSDVLPAEPSCDFVLSHAALLGKRVQASDETCGTSILSGWPSASVKPYRGEDRTALLAALGNFLPQRENPAPAGRPERIRPTGCSLFFVMNRSSAAPETDTETATGGTICPGNHCSARSARSTSARRYQHVRPIKRRLQVTPPGPLVAAIPPRKVRRTG